MRVFRADAGFGEFVMAGMALGIAIAFGALALLIGGFTAFAWISIGSVIFAVFLVGNWLDPVLVTLRWLRISADVPLQ